MRTVAIIPSGGAGKRMGGAVPKQFLFLAGAPILVYTLRAFQDSPSIDSIILTVPDEYVAEVRINIVERYFLSKVRHVVSGGRERQDSVRNALVHIENEDEIIVVHDGVRPFVTDDLIKLVVGSVEKFGAVVTGIEVGDTVKRVNKAGKIEETVPRDGLWLTQTPQAFKKDILVAAHLQAYRERFYGTDDASLVERVGVPVWMIPGDRDNLKVTTKEDMHQCERIMWQRQKKMAAAMGEKDENRLRL
jgi:2-C-methyl-D-erythritol 4-phosphate cytidylyltransferase